MTFIFELQYNFVRSELVKSRTFYDFVCWWPFFVCVCDHDENTTLIGMKCLEWIVEIMSQFQNADIWEE